MKFTLSLFVAALPLLAMAGPTKRQNQGRGGQSGQGGQFGQGGQGGNKNGGGAAATTTAAAAATTAAAAAATTTTAAATSGGSSAAGGDLQKSLTLDPSVIATGFLKDGQEVPTAGQVASLTSPNNFINFCATVPNKPIMNGQQIKTGACNPAPMGVIAATTNMPQAKFQFPPNNGVIATANTAFDVKLAIKNLATGSFTNAASTYFAAPQQVDGSGNIIGHTHIAIEALTALDQTTPGDANVFAFFKGVNDAATNGVLTVPVTAGLPQGFYKMCTINSAANHQPVLVTVAQHTSLDDCSYFTVGNPGGAATGGNGGNGNTGAAATTAAAATQTTAAGGNGGKGNNAGAGGAVAATTAAAGATVSKTAAGAAAAATTTAAATGGKGQTGQGGRGAGQTQGSGAGRGFGQGGRNRRAFKRLAGGY